MLFFPVFVAIHPCRPLDSIVGANPTILTQSPTSNGIISFADPHPLTLLESYRFKNIAGQGYPRRSDIPSFPTSLLISYSLSPLPATLIKNRGRGAGVPKL